MGLGTKQFSGDHLGEQTLFQTGAAMAEVAKAPPAATLGEALKCPRCASTNTKFCYYNNYNKSQPRHFCKSCKRHWTRGGTLRNVPVGGKNKRPKINGDQKTILHQALFRSYSPTTENNKTNPGPGLNGSDPNLSTSTSAIDVIPTYNNNQSLISYDQYATSLEESSITSCSVNNIWPGPEWNWNWNWNEIDAFTSSDHLINIAWDWDKYNDDNN